MKKWAVLFLLALFWRPAVAQNKSDSQLSPTVRLYEPKNKDGAQNLGRFVMSVVKGVKIEWEPIPQALVIRGESAQDLDAAEALLKRFDVPRLKPTPTSMAQVELTAYLVAASNGPVPKPADNPRVAGGQVYPGISTDNIQPRPVPSEIQSAIDEMKRTFSYDHYSLADILVAQPRGEGHFQGTLAPGPYLPPETVYTLGFKHAGLDEEWTGDSFVLRNKNVLLNGFEFSVQPHNVPASTIKTDVLIHENQKFVLGKLRLANADLFVILTAKVH